jgi:teichuronic acid biosynthesis glycosyltransferase TuaG
MIHSTFATCWYPLNSKFSSDIYFDWMKNMISEVNHYYLVFFTDEKGKKMLQDHFDTTTSYFQNPNIKIIIKPCEKWHNYLYEESWCTNHKKNNLLNSLIEWKVNMLWAEKVHFVNDARINHYFPPTDFYGWCDIGYFREGPCPSFAISQQILSLKNNKIYYAQVVPDYIIDSFKPIIQVKNKDGLPIIPIPAEQISIAGGFFIAHQSKIDEWRQKFDEKLRLYFEHHYLVKDDQIIILDCIISEPHFFELIKETNQNINHWFQFRRFLSLEDNVESLGVSILMPIYNGVNFLSESVLSVLQQNVKNWELLIAINGHPPNSDVYQKTLNYITQSIASDARIRLFDYHECKGKAATLNKMITECSYTYVAILDVDDIWYPNKLEIQMPYLKQKYDVIGTQCIYFGDVNGSSPNIPLGDISKFNFLSFNPIINSSAVIKKELANWNTTLFVEDYDLWLSLWKRGCRFYNCSEILVKHRIHQESAFNAKGNDNHVESLKEKYKVSS